MSTREQWKFAIGSGISVAFGRTPSALYELNQKNRTIYSGIDNVSPEDTLINHIDLLKRHTYFNDVDLSNPSMWLQVPWANHHHDIDPMDLFGLAVSFLDFHQLIVPQYLIPPKELCKSFIEQVVTSSTPLLLHEQFDRALSLVGPYPTAASILLMLCSRMCARNMDKRIFTESLLTKEILDEYPKKIASFDKDWVGEEPFDGPGNTYYFWTNMAMGMLLKTRQYNQSKEDPLIKNMFEHGTAIMLWTRKHLVDQQSQLTHKRPAKYGFSIGEYLAERALQYSL